MTEKPISSEIIKVGKYKGQPLEVLINDPEYAKWLTDQAWFRQGHSAHYNIIINNFGVPNDTPEHNMMQAKFLKPNILRRVVHLVFKTPPKTMIAISKPVFEDGGWDVGFAAEIAAFSWFDKERNKHCPYISEEFQGRLQWFQPERGQVVDKDQLWAGICAQEYTFLIELKPSMGDDFPSVLRQMKRIQKNHAKTLLILERFEATSVSFEDVSEMFGSDRIKILMLGDIENLKDLPSVEPERIIN